MADLNPTNSILSPQTLRYQRPPSQPCPVLDSSDKIMETNVEEADDSNVHCQTEVEVMFDKNPLAQWEAWAVRTTVFVLLLAGLARLLINEVPLLLK